MTSVPPTTPLARHRLAGATRVTDAIYDAGYGSVRAFYEEAAQRLGMSPRDYANGAPHHVLLWSITDTDIGTVMAVAAPQGLCSTGIGEPAELMERVKRQFPAAKLLRDDEAMNDVMSALVLLAAGRSAPDLPLHVQGTAFQARVWSALKEIPEGDTRTYAEVAQSINAPSSARAVANACGANPTAIVVPCHRVVRTDGSLGGYYWGIEIKRDLLQREATP